MLAWDITSQKASPWVKIRTLALYASPTYIITKILWISSIFTYLGRIWNYSVVTLTNFQILKTNWIKIAKSDFWEIWRISENWVSKNPPYLLIRNTCSNTERVFFGWFRDGQKPLLVFKNYFRINHNMPRKMKTKIGKY